MNKMHWALKNIALAYINSIIINSIMTFSYMYVVDHIHPISLSVSIPLWLHLFFLAGSTSISLFETGEPMSLIRAISRYTEES